MIVRAIVSGALGALFVLLACVNNWIMIEQLRGRPAPSIIPFVGGLAGAAAVFLWPYHDVKIWAVAPLLLDSGCLPYFAGAMSHIIHESWRFRKSACIKSLTGENDEKKVSIKLYKSGWTLTEQTFKDPRKSRIAASSSPGRWQRHADGGYVLTSGKAKRMLIEQDGCWRIVHEQGCSRDYNRLEGMSFTDE